jgi:hypothetical protein
VFHIPPKKPIQPFHFPANLIWFDGRHNKNICHLIKLHTPIQINFNFKYLLTYGIQALITGDLGLGHGGHAKKEDCNQ